MVNNNSDDALMSPGEVAKYLGMGERTIYQWATQETIPAMKIGTSWRFRRSEIDSWLKDNHSGPLYESDSSVSKSSLPRTKRAEAKEKKNIEKALIEACTSAIMETMNESTGAVFILDEFNESFGAEIVNKAVKTLQSQKKLKLNKKFQTGEGETIEIIEKIT